MSDWLTWQPCSLLLEIDRSCEKYQVSDLGNAYVFVEKVPKIKLDKLPEVVIS